MAQFGVQVKSRRRLRICLNGCIRLFHELPRSSPENCLIVACNRAGTSGRFRNGWYYHDRARFDVEGPLYIEVRADDVLNIGGAKIRKLAPSRPDKVFFVTEFVRIVTGKVLRGRLLEVLSEHAV